MLGNNRWWTKVKRLFSFLMAAVLAWGLVACSSELPLGKGDTASGIEPPQALEGDAATLAGAAQLSEVAPPPVLQNLSEYLDTYQPQVTIVSPNADQVLQDTTVSVQFQVQDLPVFKDPDLGLGPHLHVILDNQPYQAVYNLNQPLVLENLAPGTHTLRVFASRPWHESFKNEGAYAQTTFHVFSRSNDNNPDPALPLLTYSRPTGNYGAEPIMLDFYLTNAPLHLVAQENPDDDVADWRIRVTINGESFVLDRWSPIYLKGFKPGKNWVKLEFLDEQGNPVKNVFNETARVISYDPQGKDTLSQLVRGELSADAARGIVDPNYKAPPSPAPSPALTPSPSLSPTPSPTVTPSPIPFVAPAIEATPAETPTPEPETPSVAPTPPVEIVPTPEPEASPAPSESPSAVEEATATEEPAATAPVTEKKGWFEGLFNRFRRPAVAPSPTPESLEPEAPSPTPALAPTEPEQTPEPETSPIQDESPAPVEEPTPTEAPTPTTPSAPPSSPEVLETPLTEPIFVPETPESRAATTPQPEESVIPSEPPADLEETTPTKKSTSSPPASIINSWFEGLFNRFRPPAATPSTPPELIEPEVPLITPELVPAEPETLPTQGESPAGVEVPTPTEEATPTVTPSEPPISPEAIETPSTVVPESTEPIFVPETLESPATTPQSEEFVIITEPASAVEEPTPAGEPVTSEVETTPIIEPVPVRAIQPEESQADGLLPTLPELIETPSPEATEPEAASALPEPAPELSPATPKAAAPEPESTSDTESLTTKSESLQTSTPE